MSLNHKAEIIHGKRQIFTDMVIAAHHDDIEIMCPQGIVKGYQSDKFGLVAVVATDGSGSPRAGEYASLSDEQMKGVRRLEQIEAAALGDYSELVLLNHSSADIKDEKIRAAEDDIFALLSRYRPQTVYIHNLADKHPTHIAVAKRCIKALRRLPKDARPNKLYGCEVWRGLDWFSDEEKVVFDISGHNKFLKDLLSVFRSQVAGGKRYDLAAEGRWLANATYAKSHSVDKYSLASYAMDLTPLIQDDALDPKEFILDKIRLFSDEILL